MASIENNSDKKEYPLGKFYLLVMLMGLIGGFSALCFYYLIQGFDILYWDVILPLISFEVNGYNISLFFLPIFGTFLLILLFLRRSWGNEIKGSGVTHLFDSMMFKSADIKGRIGASKLIATAISISSGGSGGKEGPMALIGGGLGSSVGKRFNIPTEKRRILIVCSVSAGISGLFQAPIGAALFGIEVLIHGISIVEALPIFLASSIGALFMEQFLTLIGEPLLVLPLEISLESLALNIPQLLVIVILIGIIFGLIGYVWAKYLANSIKFFNNLKIALWAKAMIGAIIMGFLLVFFGDYGIGGTGIEFIHDEEKLYTFVPGVLILLGLIKMFATATYIGAGNAGGIMGPTLVIGCLFGTAVGMILNVSMPILYGLFGMAALFSSTTQAPLNIAILLAELTGNIELVPLLFVCSLTSYLISKPFFKGKSVYTLNLQKKGIEIQSEFAHILNKYQVQNVMSHDIITVIPELPLHEFTPTIHEFNVKQYPVREFGSGGAIGIVYSEVILNLPDEFLEKYTIRDIMIERDKIHSVRPTDSLQRAMDIMSENNARVLLVIKQEKNGENGEKNDAEESMQELLIGIISQKDILEKWKHLE